MANNKVFVLEVSLAVNLKALLHTNVLNDITAALFLVSFLQLAAEKKTPKTVQLSHH